MEMTMYCKNMCMKYNVISWFNQVFIILFNLKKVSFYSFKVGRYLTREMAEKNSWRPIVMKLGIRVPQGVLFDLSVTLATLLLYS